jgi:hypothetical protein
VTEEEKAIELENKFMNAMSSNECALVVVNEIMDALKFMPFGIQYVSAMDYFEGVKQKLEKR